MKFLFLLKNRFTNTEYTYSYGLLNSAGQVHKYLESIGHTCKLESIQDANCIDKSVHSFKPDIVIIEALWVPAAKLTELMNLPKYKNIHWIVRIHSDAAFLSAETLALSYINEYITSMVNHKHLSIAINNKEFHKNLSKIYNYEFMYLPNVIDLKNYEITKKLNTNHIHIGAFGAARLMKNQLFQAICSINAANKLHKTLYYHINHDASISQNNPIINNLSELFKNTPHHLVFHKWMSNHEFHELIRTMDIGLQLSFTESFNIVTADFVNNDTLIAVSEAISWMPNYSKISTVNYNKTTKKIIKLYKYRNCKILKWLNKQYLKFYNQNAQNIWTKYFGEISFE